MKPYCRENSPSSSFPVGEVAVDKSFLKASGLRIVERVEFVVEALVEETPLDVS